jgi:hypothetical protein
MTDLDTYYYRVEMPKVRQKIAEFKSEMGNWGKCKRISYLYSSLFELDAELFERYTNYKKSSEADNPYIERSLIASHIPEIEKEIGKLEREIAFIVRGSQGPNQGITPEMTHQARDYPIEYLIDVKRGMARCIFHDDHNPSMGIKNNHFHCFGCGEKGDVISLLMKRDGLSFPEAVKFLSGV